MSTRTDLPRYDHWVGGRSMPPQGGDYFATESPWDGKEWALVARGNAADVEHAVRSSKKAFESD